MTASSKANHPVLALLSPPTPAPPPPPPPPATVPLALGLAVDAEKEEEEDVVGCFAVLAWVVILPLCCCSDSLGCFA